MPEIIFDCPACKQAVQADDAWAGQEIQCPLCQALMVVPPAPAPTSREVKTLGKQLVPVPGETRLTAGGTQTARASSGSGPVFRNFQQQPVKKKSPVLQYAVSGIIVLALLAGGWFAWPYLKPHLPFLAKSDNTDGVASNAPAGNAAEAPAAAAPAAESAPVKEPPMTAPSYTLDVSQAKFTEGKVNGSITGTNFVPDSTKLEKLAGAYLLDFRQGTGATPDRGLRVYLRLNPTNTPAGQSWTVSPEMKGTPVSQVVKIWKTNPKYAALEKAYTTGFALQLEFGQLTESNTLPGKIYVALPDKEQTVVAGVFHVTSAQAGALGTTAPQSPQTPQMSPEFQKRYGPGR